MAKSTKVVGVREMIAHAKDRLMDDLRAWIDEHKEYFGDLSPGDRADLQRLVTLMSMPDNAAETLAALSVSYWNGDQDTYWEEHEKPHGYVGFRMK